MRYLREFPTVAMFISFFVFSCAAAYFGTILKLVFIAFILIALIVILINPRKFLERDIRKGLILSSSAIILAGVISFIAFDVYADGFGKYGGVKDNVKLRILECDYTLSYTSRYQAEIVESEYLQSGVKLLLQTSLGYMDEGTLVEGEVLYTALDDYLGSFDAESYYNPKGIMIVCEEEWLEIVGSDKVFSLTSLFSSLNKKLTAMITAHTDHDSGSLASAVLLGNKDGLSDSDKRDFRRIGASHLLVVSGTHFAVMVTFFGEILKKLKLGRAGRSVINIFVILLFMALTGMTPSVVRAGVMHIFAQLSALLTKKPNTVNAFAISGSLIILTNPLAAVDCGLQLSFVATYSCILVKKIRRDLFAPIKKSEKISKRIKSILISALTSAVMTSLVTLNMLPLTWLYFGEISLISIPANLLFVPLVTVLMYITGTYLLLYPLKLFIMPLAWVINIFCDILTSIAEFFAQIDGIMLAINYDFTPLFLIPLSVLCVLLPFAARRTRIKMLLASVGLCLMFSLVIGAFRISDFEKTYISYVSEKKNDGLIVKSENKTLICDISDASFGFSYVLGDEMDSLHSTEIDAILLSHYHAKHVQLINRYCEREIVRELILTEPVNETEDGIYRAINEIAALHGVETKTYKLGEPIPFGENSITVLERKYLSRSSHPITAIEISCGEDTVFYGSCSFNEAEIDTVNTAAEAEYIILGKHSPIYKKEFALAFEDEPKIFAASDYALDYMNSETKNIFDEIGMRISGNAVRMVFE